MPLGSRVGIGRTEESAALIVYVRKNFRRGMFVYLLEFGKFREIRRDSFLNVGLFTLVTGSDGGGRSPTFTVGRSERGGGGFDPGSKRRSRGSERKRRGSFGRRRQGCVTEIADAVRSSRAGR